MGHQGTFPLDDNRPGKRSRAALSCAYGTARRHASRSLALVQFVALTRASKPFCWSKMTSGRGVGKPDSYNTRCLISPQVEYKRQNLYHYTASEQTTRVSVIEKEVKTNRHASCAFSPAFHINQHQNV